ncbi:response regulator transcription factor [Plectonema cf. radiosum LEGE 06105]|uniref:Response regulator transcription factor n=1 Tax=Plectonema cf. radiosum LEGE 06105 TaxID=945769 RepID=A0A8J7F6M2_9CYAN|nr:response regulator [Plectonema radiosum]MBE9215598.1 response regulator transcription factor [Plectonema cf. radiosum LEGE 06105]
MVNIRDTHTTEISSKASLTILLIDFNEMFLSGTIGILNSQYADIKILTAQTSHMGIEQIELFKPDLVIMDIMLPKKLGGTAKINTGMQLLIYLMNNHPQTNIVVYSEYIQSLVRIKSEINSYQKGFVAADKNLSSTEIMARINWSLQGLTHIKDIQKISDNLELKPEWLRLLNLAFGEALQDKAIAQDICVSERMVRNYWHRLQQILGIDSEELKSQGKNLRIVTLKRAREAGLID